MNGHISRCELLAWPQSQCTIHGVLPTIQHLGVTLLASSCPYALYVPRIQLVARSAPANHGELFYSRSDLSVKQEGDIGRDDCDTGHTGRMPSVKCPGVSGRPSCCERGNNCEKPAAQEG